MKNQLCVNCGGDVFEELIVTINSGVKIEEDGFADCNGESKYPEPSYTCYACGTVHELQEGKLAAIKKEEGTL